MKSTAAPPPPFFLPAFAALVIGALIWLVLVRTLTARLKADHPEQFAAIGSPDLFTNNNLQSVLGLLGFIVRRKHKALGDPSLSRLCDTMLVLFVALSLGLVALQIALTRAH